jgi:hypothetical protein
MVMSGGIGDHSQNAESAFSSPAMSQASAIPIAVIGKPRRLHGCIKSPGHLCEALLRSDDLPTDIAAERWHGDNRNPYQA